MSSSLTESSPMTKKLIIETCSTEGKCYLRLIPLIKSFSDWNAEELESVVICLSTTLGEYPLTRDVLLVLRHLSKCGVENLWSKTEVVDDKQLAMFLIELNDPMYRFGFEDKEDCLHVTYYMRSPVDQGSFIEEGWHPMIILNKLTNMSLRIGGESATEANFFNTLFDESPVELVKLPGHRTKPLEAVEEEPIHNNTQKRDYSVEESMIDDIHNRIERVNQALNDLEPNDSSSQFDRYESGKRYMNHGTVLNDRNDIRSVLTVGQRSGQRLSNAYQGLSTLPTKNPVIGYMKTQDMVDIERAIHSQAYEINGLAGPFKDNRLNLLMNIDNAMSTYGFSYQRIARTLMEIRDMKPHSPSEQLLHQIVRNTFDLENMIIISNVYKFPFIEVGMHVDENMLRRSFQMIELEYKQKWFESMKMLSVPDFHNKYRVSGSSKSDNSTSKGKPQTENKKQFVRRKSSGGSVLSVLTS